jgi:phosphoribosylformylglycinamidine synthase
VVVTCSAKNAELIKSNAASIHVTELGTVTSGKINVNGEDWGTVETWKLAYDTAIEKLVH